MIMKLTIRNTEKYAMHILVTILVHKKLKRAKMRVLKYFPVLLWSMINYRGVVIIVRFTGHNICVTEVRPTYVIGGNGNPPNVDDSFRLTDTET